MKLPSISFTLLIPILCGVVHSQTITSGVFTGNLTLQANTASSPQQPGNLTVNGAVDIYGNLLNFGSAGSVTNPAVVFNYTDDPSGSNSTFVGSSFRNSVSWLWQQNGSSSLKNKMLLDQSNKLTLYDLNGVAKISIDPVASQIAINGVPLVAPNSYGNVGIGTANPLARLQISADAANGSVSGNWNNSQVRISGATNPNYKLNVGVDTTSGNGFLQSGNEGVGYTNLILNSAGGRVGIGTSSPSAKLDVNAIGVAYDGSMYPAITAIGLYSPYSNGFVKIGTGPNSDGEIILGAANPLRINATRGLSCDGFVNYSSYSSTFNGNGSQTSVPLKAKATAGQTADVFQVITSASQPMFNVAGNGNVGVGVNIPAAKLDVAGDVKVSGVVRCAAGGDIPMYSGN